jgi:CRP/FNR family transcriptional regulator, anaerobic regulatory protein
MNIIIDIDQVPVENQRIQAIKNYSFRETTCQSCTLRSLCLPLSLTTKDLDKLDAIIARGRPFEKGEMLFRQGEPFGSLFALRSGCVKTFSVTDSGEEQITGFYLPGELIGLSGIDTDIYPVNAIAIETTTVCEIPYPKFEGLTDEIPELKRQLIGSLSKTIRRDMQMMLLLSQKDAEARIANFLLDLSTRIQRRGYSADFIYLAMSRNEIANYLGLAVETVSRIFSRLQKSKAIDVNARAVEILDVDALTKAAGSCLFTETSAPKENAPTSNTN